MASASVATSKTTERGFAAVRNSAMQTESATNKPIDYTSLVQEVRRNFATRKTYSYEWRVKELQNLRRGIVELEKDILDAVHQDLRKHPNEAYQAEIVLTVGELDFALANLKEWMSTVTAKTPLHLQPGKQVIEKQPKGVCLIICPWNFPIQLALIPLISAIAAGCPCVVKPSEMAPASAKILERIITQYLDNDFYRVVQGAVAETTALLKQPWNHIFYTGNGAVGRIVARAAADNLASYTLELGGKSPVYIAPDANIRVAARRILGSKMVNLGQACVSPDYVLVHSSVRDAFIAEVKKHIPMFLGENPQKSTSLARIVNERHFDRIANMLKENHGGKIVEGGLEKADRSDNYIPITLILDPKLDSSVMHEEIFGPLLPVITVNSLDEALKIINSKESSLASYVFTETTAIADQFIKHTSSGGSCVNDCVFHIVTPHTPFGGHSGGGSGVGSYHGVAGFNEFTHCRAIFTHHSWLDPNDRYPPFNEGQIKVFRFLFVDSGIPPWAITGMKLAAAGAALSVLKSRL